MSQAENQERRGGVPSTGLSTSWQTLLWIVLFGVAVLLGQQTSIEPDYLGYSRPELGIAVLWLLSRQLRSWWGPAVSITVIVAAITLLNGGSASTITVLTVATLVLATSTVLVTNWARKFFQQTGSAWELITVADLGTLLFAASLGSAASAVVANLILVASGQGWSWHTLVAWWFTSVTNTVGVAGMGQLVISGVPDSTRPTEFIQTWSRVVASMVRPRLAEAVALLAVSAWLYWLTFVRFDAFPVVFAVVVPTIWVGMRFLPLIAHLHTLFVVCAVYIWTLDDRGPFATVADPKQALIVTQSFIVLITLLALMLALGRQERHLLLHRVRRARRHVQERALVMQSIVSSIQDGVMLVTEQGQIVLANEASRELLGFSISEQENIDVTRIDLRTPAGKKFDRGELPFLQVFDHDTPIIQDIRVAPLDGDKPRLLEVTTVPAEHEEQEARQVVVILRDVEEQRDRQEALEAFAGMAAHDLRSPVTLLGGWSELARDMVQELLEEPPHDSHASLSMLAQLLVRVQKTSAEMAEIIDDLLAITQISDAPIDLMPVDLHQLLQQVAAVQEQLATNDPTIVIEPVPPVTGDESLLRQLFANLIGNAIKYVEPGARPQIRIMGQAKPDDWVQITVSDRGIGIPREQWEEVFSAFTRLHTQDYDGHGLGLAICRRIVERMHGTIRVADNPDRIGTQIIVGLRSSHYRPHIET